MTSENEQILDRVVDAGGIVLPPEVLAKNTLEMIAGRRDRTWDQDVWYDIDEECGTVCCVAGDAVLQTGLKIIADNANITFAHIVDGVKLRVPCVARALLGLSLDQADWLFDADRTEGEVVETLELIRDGVPWAIEESDDLEELLD